MIKLIVSGMQAGVDLGAMFAAKSLGITTLGYMPKGYQTIDGPKPEYRKLYNARQIEGGYRERTLMNIELSDLTIIISDKHNSPGTILARNHCEKIGIPYIMCVPAISPVALANMIALYHPQIVNIAGNRDTNPQVIKTLLIETIKMYNEGSYEDIPTVV